MASFDYRHHESMEPTLYVPIRSPPTPPLRRHNQSSSAALSQITTLLPFLSQEDLQTLTCTLERMRRRDFTVNVPGELLLYIIFHASSVCRRWRALCEEQTLWKNLSFRWHFVEPGWPAERFASPDKVHKSFEDLSRDLNGTSFSQLTRPISLPYEVPRWKNHFIWNYVLLQNWRKGGTLLQSHRIGGTSSPSPSLASQPNSRESQRSRRSTGRATASRTETAEEASLSTAVVTSCALDDERLVVGLSNSRVQVYSAHTGVLLRTLHGHSDGVWSLGLVRSGGDWVPPPSNEEEGDCVRLLPHWRKALGLDGECDAPASSRPALRQSDPCNVSQGWGQPSAFVVSGGCDKEVRVWDAETGYCLFILKGHTQTIRCLKVLHNSPMAVSGSRDGTLRVWDIQRGKLLHVLSGHGSSVRCLDVHGRLAVSGSYDTTCRIWDLDKGECIHVLSGHFHQVYTVAWSVNGAHVVSAGLDSTVRVWDAQTGQCLALLQAHTSLIMHLHLTPTYLVSAGSDGRVVVYSLPPPSASQLEKMDNRYFPLQRMNIHEGSVTSLQISHSAGGARGWCISGGHDGIVRIFEVLPEKSVNGDVLQYQRELGVDMDSIWKVVFNDKGIVAVMGSRGGKTSVDVWDMGVRSQ
ncbi:WD40 repeat-like protein [Flagelloscypha sp. PMI_526]|nr:WD40 repeat-like protein [Flagelloscypha sp. PMI_526]